MENRDSSEEDSQNINEVQSHDDGGLNRSNSPSQLDLGFVDDLIDMKNYERSLGCLNMPIKKRSSPKSSKKGWLNIDTDTTAISPGCASSSSSLAAAAVAPKTNDVQSAGVISPREGTRCDLGGHCNPTAAGMMGPPPNLLRLTASHARTNQTHRQVQESLTERFQAPVTVPAIVATEGTVLQIPVFQISHTRAAANGSMRSATVVGIRDTSTSVVDSVYTNGLGTPPVEVRQADSGLNPPLTVTPNRTVPNVNNPVPTSAAVPCRNLNELATATRPEITRTPLTATAASAFIPSAAVCVPGKVTSNQNTTRPNGSLISPLHPSPSRSATTPQRTNSPSMVSQLPSNTAIMTPQPTSTRSSSSTFSSSSPPAITRVTPVINTATTSEKGKIEIPTNGPQPRLTYSQVVMKLIQPSPLSQNQRNVPNLDLNDDNAWPMDVYVRELRDSSGENGTRFNDDYSEGNWRKNLSMCERYNYLRTSTFDKHKRYQDVTFEIGSGEEATRLSAHHLLLSMSCDFFKSGVGNTKDSRLSPVKFPKLDPVAFQVMLDYIYTGEFHVTESSRVHAVVEVAKTVGCHELIDECNLSLRSNLTVDNAVDLYHQSLRTTDEVLKKDSLSYIIKNPRDVLFSDGFLKISQEALISILDCDDWYLDELEVFEAVKRWAEKNIPEEEGAEKMGKRLRNALGDALYSIRFVSLDCNSFMQNIQIPNEGLLEGLEPLDFIAYFATKGMSDPKPPPPKFIARPRLKRNAERIPTPAAIVEHSLSADKSKVSEDTEIISNNGASVPIYDVSGRLVIGYKHTPKNSLPPVSPPCPSNNDMAAEPPKKKRKYVRKNSTLCTSNDLSTTAPNPEVSTVVARVPVSSVEGLCAYAKKMKSKDVTKHSIDETLKLTVPTIRVHLPNLKTFSLNLVPKNQHHHGSSLRNYLKMKFASLRDILFFNIDSNGGATGNGADNSGDILESLLSHKVKISITCENIKILNIDHESGTLLINLVRDAQKIINGSGNFPLKKLALSECDLSSLDPLRKDLLEVIVIRKVKGLKNHSNFLEHCTKLREISWVDLSYEKFNLMDDLLNRNPGLNKLGLGKCKLILPPNITSTIAQQQNLLEKLYFDNCEWNLEFVTSMPPLFPFVTDVHMYGTNCDAVLLHSILNMKSIKFVFMWQLTYMYINDNAEIFSNKNGNIVPKKATTKSKEIRQFLKGVFSESFAKKEKITFKLVKRSSVDAQPGPSSGSAQDQRTNSFNPSSWVGTEYTKDKYQIVSELDYLHFSYDTFFSDKAAYAFLETTEKDVKRGKKSE